MCVTYVSAGRGTYVPLPLLLPRTLTGAVSLCVLCVNTEPRGASGLRSVYHTNGCWTGDQLVRDDCDYSAYASTRGGALRNLTDTTSN